MKKYISKIALGLSLLALASCSKDTEGLTRVMYYPLLQLDGPLYATHLAGTPFVEPGYSATIDGENVTDDVVVTTDMDFANPVPGFYTITYSIANSDGFSAVANRQVVVADNDDPVSGYYIAADDCFRNYNGIIFYGGYPVGIYASGEDTYYITDFLAGYYEFRAGYGPNYALTGEFSLDADNNMILVDSFLKGWGDGANSLTDGKFDPATSTIKYVVDYSEDGLIFNVTLNKI